MAISQNKKKIEELERRVARLEAEMGIVPDTDERFPHPHDPGMSDDHREAVRQRHEGEYPVEEDDGAE